jgi:ubiquinone/menaquinone biosynthesis C-methylase UbiE
LIAPQLKYSQSIYESVLDENTREGQDWLDLGCGHHLLPPWRVAEERRLLARPASIVGLDYSLDSLRKHRNIRRRVRGDIAKLPFKSKSFDLISSNMVFEHLQEPEEQLAEIFRVLRPGGLLVFHTPNKFGYALAAGRLLPAAVKTRLAGVLQDRASSDVFPTFYRINSSRTITELAERVGFHVRETRLIVSSATLIMIPPLAVLELLLLRLLMTQSLQQFRTNIIAVLEKPRG